MPAQLLADGLTRLCIVPIPPAYGKVLGAILLAWRKQDDSVKVQLWQQLPRQQAAWCQGDQMKLSEHFTLEEMTFSQTASREGIDNTPDKEALNYLHDLAAALEQVRTLLGNQSILISSGYRCPELNAAVGGSTTSAHMVGMAADLTSPPLTPLEICRMIEASPLTFDQLIYEFGSGPFRHRAPAAPAGPDLLWQRVHRRPASMTLRPWFRALRLCPPGPSDGVLPVSLK